jgi:hypothetical protein
MAWPDVDAIIWRASCWCASDADQGRAHQDVQPAGKGTEFSVPFSLNRRKNTWVYGASGLGTPFAKEAIE